MKKRKRLEKDVPKSKREDRKPGLQESDAKRKRKQLMASQNCPQ
jgi:hypothetical protein